MQKIILNGSFESDSNQSLTAPKTEIKPGLIPIKKPNGKVANVAYGLWDVLLDQSKIAEMKKQGNVDMVVAEIYDKTTPSRTEALTINIVHFYDNFMEDISDFQKKTIQKAPLSSDILSEPVVNQSQLGQKDISFFLMFQDNQAKRYCLEIHILKSQIINELLNV